MHHVLHCPVHAMSCCDINIVGGRNIRLSQQNGLSFIQIHRRQYKLYQCIERNCYNGHEGNVCYSILFYQQKTVANYSNKVKVKVKYKEL